MPRIFTTGIFDLFHVGHLRALKKAQSLGDYLMVGVHTDLEASSYKRQPIIPFQQRIEIVRAIAYVNEAFECPLIVDEQFYHDHQIDLHCQGDEPEGIDIYPAARRLGILTLVGRDPNTDTSRILQSIRKGQ